MNEKEVKAIQTLATALGRELDRTVREKAKLEDEIKRLKKAVKYYESRFPKYEDEPKK